MKKSVVIFITAVCLLITGCGDTGSLSKLPSSSFHEDKQKLTIMHIDADNKRFQDFIEETEKKLDMEITVEKCPSNADNRQAKISTILASGDKNIDLISVNDEMISEFKHKGYLEPLENVMTEEVRDSFPQKYLESICEENGHIYSVPFQMDIMMFWVNQELLKQAGLDEIKNTGDFDILQKSLKNPDQYAYGDAWENTHVYNSLSQFVNFWGGDYFDWTDPKTKDAARYMKSMLDEKNTSPAQFVDQYEQMEEKFIRGKYGCVFMYTSALGTFLDADVYGKNKIHMAPLPVLHKKKATNIATWQYVLNNASENKDAAVRFLQYAAGYEGSIEYAKIMKSYPARVDVIENEDIDLEGIDMIRKYLREYTLNARPLCENSMGAVSDMGKLFQGYVLGQCEEDSFFEQAQNCINTYY